MVLTCLILSNDKIHRAKMEIRQQWWITIPNMTSIFGEQMIESTSQQRIEEEKKKNTFYMEIDSSTNKKITTHISSMTNSNSTIKITKKKAFERTMARERQWVRENKTVKIIIFVYVHFCIFNKCCHIFIDIWRFFFFHSLSILN